MQLIFRDLGGDGHHPLVVLHGLLGSSRNWLTAGADLSAIRHVIAPDLRNHGMSPHDPTHTYDAMQADVLETLEQRGIESFDLLGHSMGGKLAMHMACRHPDRVTALIAVDIAPRDYRLGEHASQFAAMNMLKPEALSSRQEAEEALQWSVGDLGTAKFLATNLERREEGGFQWRINLPVLSEAVDELGKTPLTSDDRYEGPTLFITGDESDYVRESDQPKIAAHFPRAVFGIVPGAGHNPHIDARSSFVHEVRKFLSSAE